MVRVTLLGRTRGDDIVTVEDVTGVTVASLGY